jgi:hypothetical protein
MNPTPRTTDALVPEAELAACLRAYAGPSEPRPLPRRRVGALARVGGVVAAGCALVLLAVLVGTDGDGARPELTASPEHPANARFATVVHTAEPVSITSPMLDALNVLPGSLRLVATFETDAGPFAKLYVARTKSGGECLLDEFSAGSVPDGRPLRAFGGGCSASIFSTRDVAFIAGSGRDREGGVQSYVLGILDAGVAEVAVEDASGQRHAPERHGAAFLYRSKSSGTRPVAVVSRNGTDRENRYPLGRR